MSLQFQQTLDDLSRFRAGHIITGIDLFRIFVVIETSYLEDFITTLIHWIQKVKSILKFEVHPVSILFLTRVYFICAKHYHFAYSETTKILKNQNKNARYPVILRESIQRWQQHITDGHVIDDVKIGGSSYAGLLDLEKKSAIAFQNENRFCAQFPNQTMEEESLFAQFRMAIQRSQSNEWIRGVFFFDAFREMQFEDVTHGYQIIRMWTNGLKNITFEYEPATVFLFSRMFCNLSKSNDLTMHALLSGKIECDKATMCSLLRDKSWLQVWSHYERWQSYVFEQLGEQIENIANIISDSIFLNNLTKPFDLLHPVTPIVVVTFPKRPRVCELFQGQLFQKVLIQRWKFFTLKGKTSMTNVIAKWKAFVLKQKTTKLEILQYWQTKVKRRHYLIQFVISQWRKTIVMRKVIANWKYCVSKSQQDLRKYKKWRKRAKKLLCNERKAKNKQIAKWEKQRKEKIQECTVRKYFSKWKMFVIERRLKTEMENLRKVKILQFREKRYDKIRKLYFRKWKTFVVSCKMFEFQWEKQLIGFTGQILSSCMNKIAVEFQYFTKCNFCRAIMYYCEKTKQDLVSYYECCSECDFSRWFLLKKLFEDFCELIKNIVVVSPETCFTVISKTLKLLFKHQFTRNLVDIKLMRKYSSLLELTYTLHESFQRIRMLFVRISTFGVKKAMLQILHIASRFQVFRGGCPRHNFRKTNWMKRNELPEAFGTVSYETCEIGIEIWYKATNEYIEQRKNLPPPKKAKSDAPKKKKSKKLAVTPKQNFTNLVKKNFDDSPETPDFGIFRLIAQSEQFNLPSANKDGDVYLFVKDKIQVVVSQDKITDRHKIDELD